MGWLLAAPDLRTLTSIPLEPQALYRFHLGNPRAKIGPRRCDFIPGAGGGARSKRSQGRVTRPDVATEEGGRRLRWREDRVRPWNRRSQSPRWLLSRKP